jgi:hypothetical protein
MGRIRLLPAVLLVFTAVAVLVLAMPRGATAQCDAPTACLPALGCAYIGPSAVTYPGTPIAIRNLSLQNPSHCEPPSNVDGFVVDSFFDVFVELEVSTNGGGTFSPAAWNRRVSDVHIVHPPGTPPGTYRTEMLQLDLTSSGNPIPMLIRESPTLQSLGQATITPNGGGFHIDSFFDVFTELSLDGGQTWIPSSGPDHMTNAPFGPTPTRRSTWGAIKTIYR